MENKANSALMAIPPMGAGERDKWKDITAAFIRAGGDYSVWDNWCSNAGSGYNQRQNKAVWDSYAKKTGAITEATLYAEAKKYGWEPYNTNNVHCVYNTVNTRKADYMGTKDNKTEQKHPRANFRQYIDQCNAAAGDTDFFSKRGITADSVTRFNLGYDKAQKMAIIPYDTDGSYYIGRNVTYAPDGEKGEGIKHYKPSVEIAGEEPVYNRLALDYAAKNGTPVFICESPLDAISIMQAGGTAVATGGTADGKLLKYIEVLKDKGETIPPLIIATDADKGGDAEADKLAETLGKMDIVNTRLYFPDDVKKDMPKGGKKADANSFLMADKVRFEAAISGATQEAAVIVQEAAALELEVYNAGSGAARLDSYISQWDAGKDKAISTGFNNLDSLLDGGLFPGLYVIGAISSLGKTTFVLQIADQIAAAGYDVLFFSLEQGADELTAKTLSRITAICSRDSGEDYKQGLTNRAISSKEKREAWKQDSRKDTVEQAQGLYRQFAQNIFIVQGLGDISPLQIREAVKKHKRIRGKTPIVFIDYVQIMDSPAERLTDKQIMDKNIVELKRISRDYNTPVLGISSFNRDSYISKVTLSAFKESGAVEYTSDVVIGLQPQGMKDGENDTVKKDNRKIIDDCKNSHLRHLEAVILKNRNGSTGMVNFEYRTLFNLYDEKGIKPKENKAQTESGGKYQPF